MNNIAEKSGYNLDPTTYAVVTNKFEFLVKENIEKILYSTQSFVTANARDLGATLLTGEGHLVVAASSLHGHTLVSEEAVKGCESVFHGDYHPGDFIISNDAYIVKGGHLPDWNFLRPCFYKGRLVAWLQAKTHVFDTGGHLPGGYGPGAYDIIAEGLNIPPFKLYDQGVLQKGAWSIVCRNVRNPESVDMDANLINGVLAQCEEKIIALMDKYGCDTVLNCMEELIDTGSRSMKAEIAKLPDGEYYGESAADWDGVTDKPIYVRAKVTIKGEDLTIDLSDSDPQGSFINCALAMTVCHSISAVFITVDPSVPKNYGSTSAMTVITKPGTCADPIYPATVGGGQITVGAQIWEAVMFAMAKAVPDRAMGAWTRHLCPINVGMDPRVIDPRSGRALQYFSETFASDAGAGAVKGYDGWNGVAFAGADGNFMRPNMENFELNVPYMNLRYEFLPDYEGAGEFRGSPGVYTEVLANVPDGVRAIVQTGNSDGCVFSPKGIGAAVDAPPSEMWLIKKDGTKRPLRTMVNDTIVKGERYETLCAGGGGWGNPLDRDIARVVQDVKDTYVTVGKAKNVYGVVMDPDTLEVDYAATEALRKEKKAAQSA
jgi:N-methylhydantoinase B/acetone carboxylase, alpha subunit